MVLQGFPFKVSSQTRKLENMRLKTPRKTHIKLDTVSNDLDSSYSLTIDVLSMIFFSTYRK